MRKALRRWLKRDRAVVVQAPVGEEEVALAAAAVLAVVSEGDLAAAALARPARVPAIPATSSAIRLAVKLRWSNWPPR